MKKNYYIFSHITKETTKYKNGSLKFERLIYAYSEDNKDDIIRILIPEDLKQIK